MDQWTDGQTDRPTKWVVESCSTRLKTTHGRTKLQTVTASLGLGSRRLATAGLHGAGAELQINSHPARRQLLNVMASIATFLQPTGWTVINIPTQLS